MRTYSAVDACRISRCTYRQLDYWLRLGVLGDAHRGANMGSGSRRVLTGREVELIAVCTGFARVAKGGIGVIPLKVIVELVRPHEAMTGWVVAYGDGHQAMLVDSPEDFGRYTAGVFVALPSCRLEVLELEASVTR